MTARESLAPWTTARLPFAGGLTSAVVAFRSWRARGRAVRRGRENGDRSEVIARFRAILERDAHRVESARG
jgi:hypothetical protein